MDRSEILLWTPLEVGKALRLDRDLRNRDEHGQPGIRADADIEKSVSRLTDCGRLQAVLVGGERRYLPSKVKECLERMSD